MIQKSSCQITQEISPLVVWPPVGHTRQSKQHGGSFFCDQRGSGEELKHLGAPASFYSIIFSMSTFKIKKNAFLCYIITTFALLSCKEWENDCFLTVPPAYVCNILIWKFWLELMIVHICTAAWSCAFNLQYAGIKAVRAADYPLCTKPVPPQLLRSH